MSVRCGHVPQNCDREGLAKARVAGEVCRIYVVVFGRTNQAPAFLDVHYVSPAPVPSSWERRAPARLQKPRWSVAVPGTTLCATSVLRVPSPGGSRTTGPVRIHW